jgi:hypothetical protein
MDFKEWFRENGTVYVKGPEGETIGFVQDRSGTEVAVVNPRKLDAAFQMSKGFYVGPAGEGGIAGRYEGFKTWYNGGQKWHRQGGEVEMPAVYFTSDARTRKQYAEEPSAWQVNFENGRHRFAYFRDHGWNEIPVQVPAGERLEFEKRFR